VILEVLVSAFYMLKTGKYVHVFYNGVWVHQHSDGVIVDTKICRDVTIPKLIEEVNNYCFYIYQPSLGDVILDVGAGIGSETFVFSVAVGRNGKVVSVEAHPKTFFCLKKMCEYNRLKNVSVLNLAVIDKESEVFIENLESYMATKIVSNGQTGIPVRGTTLDQIMNDLNITHIDFLKMNIEGAEKLAIKGMLDTIKRTRHVCIACHDFITDRDPSQVEMKTKNEVANFLLDNGFDVFVREDEEMGWLRDCVYGVNYAL